MDIRDALVALIQAQGISRFQPFERYLKNTRELAQWYAVDNRINGGFLRRKTRKNQPQDGLGPARYEEFEAIVIAGFTEDEHSTEQFEQRLDAMMDASVQQPRIAGYTSQVSGQVGFELVRNEPAMFAGHLVHYAVLSIRLQQLS